jgi:hypothetical protein
MPARPWRAKCPNSSAALRAALAAGLDPSPHAMLGWTGWLAPRAILTPSPIVRPNCCSIRSRAPGWAPRGRSGSRQFLRGPISFSGVRGPATLYFSKKNQYSQYSKWSDCHQPPFMPNYMRMNEAQCPRYEPVRYERVTRERVTFETLWFESSRPDGPRSDGATLVADPRHSPNTQIR